MAKEIPLSQGKYAVVDDGDFEWLTQWKWFFAKGYANRTGSKGRKYRGKDIPMHRQILDAPDGLQVDHINGDTLDNRRRNLRLVTSAQNHWNQAPVRGITSKYKGVSWDKPRHKWTAHITCHYEQKNIGRFCSEEEAARAYDQEARRLFGEFARTNFDWGGE